MAFLLWDLALLGLSVFPFELLSYFYVHDQVASKDEYQKED